MVQEEMSVEESFVEKLSASFNEPSWMRQYRMEALKQFRVLPEEISNLYTRYGLDLKIDFAEACKDRKDNCAP